MQEYRSGHNEAVLKTVWVKAHGGSNPSSCAKKTRAYTRVFSFYIASVTSAAYLLISQAPR